MPIEIQELSVVPMPEPAPAPQQPTTARCVEADDSIARWMRAADVRRERLRAD